MPVREGRCMRARRRRVQCRPAPDRCQCRLERPRLPGRTASRRRLQRSPRWFGPSDRLGPHSGYDAPVLHGEKTGTPPPGGGSIQSGLLFLRLNKGGFAMTSITRRSALALSMVAPALALPKQAAAADLYGPDEGKEYAPWHPANRSRQVPYSRWRLQSRHGDRLCGETWLFPG